MSTKRSVDKFSIFVKQCVNTCISFVKVMIRLPHVPSLPSAEAASCAVLGNGPSLKDSLAAHPAFFKERPLICVNNFAMANEFTELKPLYYVMLDPGYWLHSGNETVIKAIEALKTKTTWKMYLLLPVHAKKAESLRELAKQNPNIQIVFFNYTVFRGFKSIGHFFYKRNMAMVQSQNVLAASLFLSINLGFKDVYFFGADHTWHENMFVNDENVLCVKQVHFYDNAEKISYIPFYKGTDHKEMFGIAEILATFAKTFTSYTALNDYAKSRGCNIYNASTVSFIDAFKRIKL